MATIDIEKTQLTPSILLDKERGLIEIKGDSLPENTAEFYKPLMVELKDYFNSPQDKTIINLEITYFNSSSSKLFFDFFDLLENASLKYNIEINWRYDEENESMEEAGEDFKEDFETLTFNLIIL
ncbi:MAG: DUF1987 domain-containing protein [Campylobacterota bacterium]|nr:DUF1987 domain-containing protein [Campylobacterota bacterium]